MHSILRFWSPFTSSHVSIAMYSIACAMSGNHLRGKEEICFPPQSHGETSMDRRLLVHFLLAGYAAKRWVSWSSQVLGINFDPFKVSRVCGCPRKNGISRPLVYANPGSKVRLKKWKWENFSYFCTDSRLGTSSWFDCNLDMAFDDVTYQSCINHNWLK